MTHFHKLVPDGLGPFADVPLHADLRRGLPLHLSRRACALGLMAADVAAVLLSCTLALAAAPVVGGVLGGSDAPLTFQNVQASAVEFGLVFAGLFVFLAVQGHYHKRQLFWRTLRQVLFATGVAVLCNGFIEYAFNTHTSRLLVIGTWLLFPLIMVVTRHLAVRLLQAAGIWTIRTVVVGEGPAAELARTALLSDRLGYEVAGVVGTDAMEHGGMGKDLLRRFRAHMLVLAPDDGQAGGQAGRALLEELQRHAQPFAMMAPAHGLPLLAAEPTCFPEQDLVMLSFARNDTQRLARAGKTLLDVAGAATLLTVLSPLFLVLGIAVKLDGGPAFYAHTRLGAGRRRFGCLKFRSMRTDSAAVLRELLLTDPACAAEWAATQKLRDDPRVTRLGRILRATSLDELPQLLNVLRGEMSLVGPRPIVDAEVVHYGPAIDYYFQARPGLTGLWQVSGRSDVGYHRRVQLDVIYVKNWTLWNDLAILCRTIPAVLKRRGAV